MTHQEICDNRTLIIVNYDPNDNRKNKEKVPLFASYKAAVILEELENGTYLTIKNIEGSPGVVVSQKEVTKFMLKYGL